MTFCNMMMNMLDKEFIYQFSSCRLANSEFGYHKLLSQETLLSSWTKDDNGSLLVLRLFIWKCENEKWKCTEKRTLKNTLTLTGSILGSRKCCHLFLNWSYVSSRGHCWSFAVWNTSLEQSHTEHNQQTTLLWQQRKNRRWAHMCIVKADSSCTGWFSVQQVGSRVYSS